MKISIFHGFLMYKYYLQMSSHMCDSHQHRKRNLRTKGCDGFSFNVFFFRLLSDTQNMGVHEFVCFTHIFSSKWYNNLKKHSLTRQEDKWPLIRWETRQRENLFAFEWINGTCVCVCICEFTITWFPFHKKFSFFWYES